MAANLLVLGGVQPIHKIVPPPRKSPLRHPDELVRNSFIDHERDEAERRRTVLAFVVIFAGAAIAAFALWQAHAARTVYVPVPTEIIVTPDPRRPVAVEGTISGKPTGTAALVPVQTMPTRVVTTAPAMPMRQPAASPVVMPTPVDYAARDREIAGLKRQIDQLDETVRRVRADPHYYGLIKGSTDTARQQSSDEYLAWLDKQRDTLRRRKWALEGR